MWRLRSGKEKGLFASDEGQNSSGAGSRRISTTSFRPQKTSKNIAYLISYDYESGNTTKRLIEPFLHIDRPRRYHEIT